MTERAHSKPGFGRVAIAITAIFAVLFVISKVSPRDEVSSPTMAKSETYRLVHAIGNTERESARGLSKNECEEKKRELKSVGTALRSYNENTGYGSIACLPESSF